MKKDSNYEESINVVILYEAVTARGRRSEIRGACFCSGETVYEEDNEEETTGTKRLRRRGGQRG